VPSGSTVGAPTGWRASELSDVFNGVLPIWMDAGYRFSPNMVLAGYFQYGAGFVNKDKVGCSIDVSCYGSDIWFGAELHYHLSPNQRIDPWGGIGTGYELLDVGFQGGGTSVDLGLSGVQFFNLQAGIDLKSESDVGVGPFVTFGLGEFSSCSISGGGSLGRCTIEHTEFHEWVTVGVRFVTDIR
jgi:hypothetical protein